MDATNSNVFETIARPIIDATINGIDATVFSYGQCNSGKTHTMIGTAGEPGLIPLSIKHIFEAISNTVEREFLLRFASVWVCGKSYCSGNIKEHVYFRASYLEICDEKVNDLLNLKSVNLKLHRDDSKQIIIKCKEEPTNSLSHMLSVMQKGLKNRWIRESSRDERSISHSIFRIVRLRKIFCISLIFYFDIIHLCFFQTIESQEVGGDSESAVQVSRLNLVDLAGFGKAHETNAAERQQIDVSLSTLRSIIAQLHESQSDQIEINYNSSKLTEIMQSSLGGNALTAMICTVTPVALEETYHTLSLVYHCYDAITA